MGERAASDWHDLPGWQQQRELSAGVQQLAAVGAVRGDDGRVGMVRADDARDQEVGRAGQDQDSRAPGGGHRYLELAIRRDRGVRDVLAVLPFRW